MVFNGIANAMFQKSAPLTRLSNTFVSSMANQIVSEFANIGQ